MSANDRQVGGDFYRLPIQIWDFVHRHGIGFLAGNAIKYLCRYKSKGGIADLEKAKHYVEKLIEEEKAAAARAHGNGEEHIACSGCPPHPAKEDRGP